MRTGRIEVSILHDSPYDDYKEGDVGYVDGYCRGGDDIPYAIVIINDRFCMVPLRSLKFLSLVQYIY